MPVIRIDNYVDDFRVRAHSNDLHELAARPGKKHVTEFVNQRILETIQTGASDVLVDVGCGDGSLVRMAHGRVATCIGITRSVEEQKKLRSAIPGPLFIASQAQFLPLASRSASKIVCNATLHLLPHEGDVQAALREIARIARPGATIWVGEIPEIDEYKHYGTYRGTSMLGFMWYLLRHNGLRTFLGMARRWAKALIGTEQIVLNSAGLFYACPERMISMAEGSGLRLRAYFRHKDCDNRGKVVESQFRYDYIFTV